MHTAPASQASRAEAASSDGVTGTGWLRGSVSTPVNAQVNMAFSDMDCSPLPISVAMHHKPSKRLVIFPNVTDYRSTMTQLLFDPNNARDRLLSAAAKLFHRKGFAATTVRDIGAEVGILSGSLFHHVRSKDDMLFAVMERVIAAMTQDLSSALSRATDTRSRLHALITVELAFLHGPNRHATAVLFHDWRALSVEKQATLLDGRNAYFQLWNDVLSTANAQQLTAVDPVVLRQFLHGALAWTSYWYRPDHATPATLTLEALADQALAMIIPASDS